MVAAKIDTLFVAISCNRDFNEFHLERNLALAYEAGILPVVVITNHRLQSLYRGGSS